MNKFEQTLLKKGSLELICSYIEEYKGNLSPDFKKNLIEKVNPILQLCDAENLTCSQRKFMEMELEPFFDQTGAFLREEGLRKRFLKKCNEYDIHTVKDLRNFGRVRVLRMKNIGRKTISLVAEAFEEAGLERF